MMGNKRFNKACALIEKKKFDKARFILKKIKCTHPLALVKYSESFYEQGIISKKNNKNNEAFTYFQRSIYSDELLCSKTDINSFALIASKSFYELIQLYYDEIPNDINHESLEALKINLSRLEDGKYTRHEQLRKLKEKHIYRIGEIYFKCGIQDEKRNKISDALKNYSNAIKYYKSLDNNKLYFDTIARAKICKLKNGNIINPNNLELFDLIDKSKKSYKQDFYYRFAISLIKQKEFEQAERIIEEKLTNNVSEVQKLKEIIAKINIIHINEQLKKLHHNGLNIDDLLKLYDSIKTTEKELANSLIVNKNVFKELKPSIVNRILQYYYENKLFGKIINFIIKYNKFFDSPSLLKDLGNACFNYLKDNRLTKNNYKILISSFLTSAYSDKVLLYSLEQCDWDDDFTFTLADSVGSAYKFHSELPDNVNYNEISESNYSIGEAQRLLISQFESLLNEQELDSNVNKEIQEFYNSEKNAIESIINIIPNDIIFATPYFAKKFEIAYTIINELEHIYKEYSNEESLKAGIPYLFDNRDTCIKDYFNATKTIDRIIDAVKRNNISDLRECLSYSQENLIYKFESLGNELEDKLVKIINITSKKDPENEDFLNIIQNIIERSPNKEKLKYHFVNYALTLCISKINAGNMTNFKGLQIMSYVYKLQPNNTKVCINIISLIRMNIFDILNDKTNNVTAIYTILDDIINNKSASFKHNANELVKTKKEILNQLPEQAKTTIFIGTNLNSQGRKLKKALDYLDNLGRSFTINIPFDTPLDLPF